MRKQKVTSISLLLMHLRVNILFVSARTKKTKHLSLLLFAGDLSERYRCVLLEKY